MLISKYIKCEVERKAKAYVFALSIFGKSLFAKN